MDSLSYEAWDTALLKSGYKLDREAQHGSRLYQSDSGRVMISHYSPNAATRGWLQREGVKFFQSLDDGRQPYRGDRPEFGLSIVDGYHDDPSFITKTMLSVFMDSPLEFYHQFITGLMPRKQMTRQMKLGAICHAMLLEKKRIDETCIPYPGSCFSSNGRLISKRAVEFEGSVSPLLALRQEVIDMIPPLIENARRSEFGALLDIHSEKAIFETRVDGVVAGVPVKCKPDIAIVLNDQVIVPDLKFVERIKPDDFWRNARNFKYWLQQAHYAAILEQKYKRPVTWRFWAFEAKFPYRVVPYWYGDRSAEIARDTHKLQLEELKRAMDTNIWEDRFANQGEINPWDVEVRGAPDTYEEMTEVTFDGQEYESEEF